MKPKQRQRIRDFITHYRVAAGRRFALSRVKPGDTHGIDSKARAEALLREGVELLAEMQDKLYAQDRWSLLLVFQAMGAAGRDGTIKHVMSGINPQGSEVSSFNAPSTQELDAVSAALQAE